jgi:hypothetical protein
MLESRKEKLGLPSEIFEKWIEATSKQDQRECRARLSGMRGL